MAGSAVSRGKGSLLDRVSKSAVQKAEMQRRFGFVPMSVLKLSRGALSRKMFVYQGERPERRRAVKPTTDGPSSERKHLGVVGALSVSGHGEKRTTYFPAELVDFFVKYYAEPGQTYLDPFMGGGVAMQVAKLRGMNYYGYDCSKEFFRYVEFVKGRIDDGETVLSVTCGDSRFPDEVPDGIGDFSFYSPPYWDTENYGDEPEQLGTGKTYNEFLGGLKDVAQAWLPKFKTGAWHVVNVNDFRREGMFYPFHSDVISLYRQAGWAVHDIWIIEGLIGGLAIMFSVDFNRKRIAPKTHEYAIVFRRP